MSVLTKIGWSLGWVAAGVVLAFQKWGYAPHPEPVRATSDLSAYVRLPRLDDGCCGTGDCLTTDTRAEARDWWNGNRA